MVASDLLGGPDSKGFGHQYAKPPCEAGRTALGGLDKRVRRLGKEGWRGAKRASKGSSSRKLGALDPLLAAAPVRAASRALMISPRAALGAPRPPSVCLRWFARARGAARDLQRNGWSMRTGSPWPLTLLWTLVRHVHAQLAERGHQNPDPVWRLELPYLAFGTAIEYYAGPPTFRGVLVQRPFRLRIRPIRPTQSTPSRGNAESWVRNIGAVVAGIALKMQIACEKDASLPTSHGAEQKRRCLVLGVGEGWLGGTGPATFPTQNSHKSTWPKHTASRSSTTRRGGLRRTEHRAALPLTSLAASSDLSLCFCR